MKKYKPSFESNDANTYNLDLKDIDPELAKRVSQHQELNRLLDTANKFFQNALTYAEEPNIWMNNVSAKGNRIAQAEMIQAEFGWAMEQIERAKLLILDKAKQKQ